MQTLKPSQLVPQWVIFDDNAPEKILRGRPTRWCCFWVPIPFQNGEIYIRKMQSFISPPPIHFDYNGLEKSEETSRYDGDASGAEFLLETSNNHNERLKASHLVPQWAIFEYYKSDKF